MMEKSQQFSIKPVVYQNLVDIKKFISLCKSLTLILLTWTKWWAPVSARKWRMGFNSAFKGLIPLTPSVERTVKLYGF
jgi:phosphoglycerol transferase MdoB-like AlkP superfamily enzyme